MPYKRPARVLFLSADEKAQLAVQCAGLMGSTLINARASTQIPPPNDALAWADLVVSLDPTAHEHLPQLLTTTRHVHWPVVDTSDIETRVKGMLGGMRMLERTSESATKS